ncbi:exodeoxyribonuclease I [Catenovulum agarivorans]|uniref:exodeoxyribonuclease I n=1 Tax=Catenovulum agarivorans TaxID=1172192 RepID=UPI0002E67B29|nr:exodeoxyribonuclease I [Catenovulum agarivorans]
MKKTEDNKTQSYNKNQPSILWHDFETFGTNPKLDHPSQFAAIRTDLELNEIDEPKEYFCKLPMDYLPNPEACLITKITPQIVERKGVCEHQFMQKVLAEMSKPNTCSAGYNTIRFDDEVTRYSAYRNFFNPYEREWKNGNSRWDIIDLVRTCYALRPEGINWPKKEDGSPSFKLEDLTVANGLAHENAHDAVSDVRATIAMARLIKEKQPKLYQYIFDMRNKRKLAELIDINNLTPLMHVSSKIKAEHGCCTWICPIAWHPTNNNAVIVLNLALDPKPLVSLSVDEIKQNMFKPSSEFAEGESRLPIKLIHLNKCPVLATAKTLLPENAERLKIDRQRCLDNLAFIKQNPVIREKLTQVYESMEFDAPVDADFALYDGFASDADQAVMEQIQQKRVDALAEFQPHFENERYSTLWFRFKGRNYPHLLSVEEQAKWRAHCQQRLTDDSGTFGLSINSFAAQIQQLAEQHSADPQKMAVLRSLYQYLNEI